jgi:hypothetical protein
MLGCNQDITLWIRKKIPGTNQEVFKRQVLPVKCRWRNHTERNISGGAASVSASTAVIIPYYDGLIDLQIKEGDIMALGVCDIDITGNAPYTAGEVRRLLAPNIAVIRSVACNFEQNMKGRHMRLTGN